MGAMGLQAKKRQGPGRRWRLDRQDRFPPYSQREHSPAHTLTLDLWLPEPGERTLLV